MKKVGIICGGFSSEFEISVKSAKNIRNHFPAGFEVYLIEMDRTGWRIEVDGQQVPFDHRDFSFMNSGSLVKIDMAVVYIHGDPGENGKIQAYLEMIGIPYLNSGPLASQLSFDKWFCNQFLRGFGIRVAESVYLADHQEKWTKEGIIGKLGLPVFVKPCDSGSSFGIARVNKEGELAEAIANAFKEGKSVVIEAFLNGTEVTCGVYRNKSGIQALPLTEIVSKKEFFDYEAKYLGLSDEITPARIEAAVALRVQEIAKKIYGLLGLRSIARIDFMIVAGEPTVIEVNTTPGFSDASIVPKMVLAQGMSVQDLWQEIVEVEGINA